MLTKLRWLLAVVVWLFASVPSAHAECYSYDNSHPYDTGDPNYGAVCIGTGPDCVQCYIPAGTGSDPSNQDSVCVWGFDSPWDEWCVYFGAPDNQIP